MKRCYKLIFAVMVMLGLLTGCASSNNSVEIKGEVWFKERMALPADATLTIQVLDISKMDTAAVVLAEVVKSPVKSNSPFEFVIPADQFQQGHTYAVGARIRIGDKLMFINTQTYRIDLNATEPMSVLVQRVGR